MAGGNIRLTCDRRLLGEGIILLVLGLIMPLVLNEASLDIYASLFETLYTDDPTGMIVAAIKLAVMNTVRAIPHYLGAFLINDSLALLVGGKRRFTFNVLTTFLIIGLFYRLIDFIYPISYDFGAPAVITVVIILILSYMNLFSVSWINKFLMLLTLLSSVHSLDVVPLLSRYGFGRGEISWDIKMVAAFTGNEFLLNLFILAVFLAFLLASLIQIQLLYKEHRLRVTAVKNRQVEKELHDTQLQALHMRTFGEVQSLVHDLKTPLTTIQGLVTLSAMMEESPKIHGYLDKIADSVSSMSSMISEILYEDRKSVFTIGDMMRIVLAQVSIQVPEDMLVYTNQCRDARLEGNRIRLSRAIINAIENSRRAVDGERGRIVLNIYRKDGRIIIQIRDNGHGIPPDELPHVWEPGYSGNASTGLGLSFVRQVVENHGGGVSIESEENRYTQITMSLKEAEQVEQADHHTGH